MMKEVANPAKYEVLYFHKGERYALPANYDTWAEAKAVADAINDGKIPAWVQEVG